MPHSQLFDKLRKLYRDQLDKVDLFVGGMLESDEGRPGPLFRKIIREQFERLRDADRFWFENRQNGCVIFGFFLAKHVILIYMVYWEHASQRVTRECSRQKKSIGIRKIRMYDIILAATDIRAHEIQKNVFFHVKAGSCNSCPSGGGGSRVVASSGREGTTVSESWCACWGAVRTSDDVQSPWSRAVSRPPPRCLILHAGIDCVSANGQHERAGLCSASLPDRSRGSLATPSLA
ncbi:hypothetical protein HPB49_003279 [Dermacentor silvarum]|uniref:Uncharacterized protein n=1 Tax=Dermacentor silvarum TaxID=543639 RepID=A0ACB8DAK8_DERSI|nr:hypothetical protein HPB49_003279 [Dermacentor silvarum]